MLNNVVSKKRDKKIGSVGDKILPGHILTIKTMLAFLIVVLASHSAIMKIKPIHRVNVIIIC